MAQWGSNDRANNSPIWAPAQLKQEPNTANRDAAFGNTSANGFGTDQTVGIYGVSESEVNASGTVGELYDVNVLNAGSGYTNVIAVSFDGDGTGATATARMKLVSLTVAHGGNNYAPGDILTPSDGTSVYGALINVVTTEMRSATVNAAGSGYTNGDVITLTTGTGTKANATVTTNGTGNASSVSIANAGIYTVNPTNLNAEPTTNSTGSGTGLTLKLVTKLLAVAVSNSGLYSAIPTTSANPVTNVTGLGVSANLNLSLGLADITLTNVGADYTEAPTVDLSGAGGSAASAEAVIWDVSNSNDKGITHTGWVLRTEGSGGRAGRVNYEVLVAGGISGDASDDTILPEN